MKKPKWLFYGEPWSWAWVIGVIFSVVVYLLVYGLITSAIVTFHKMLHGGAL